MPFVTSQGAKLSSVSGKVEEGWTLPIPEELENIHKVNFALSSIVNQTARVLDSARPHFNSLSACLF